ncbi:transcriptional regulator [Desulfosarcina alkanivorans]|uniref:Transcriptional regulator n=1 Tax=Desulfosarcina alkanivorans TaxID=571177 RepID=A0A5K7YDX5_9BACT|nr:response regulator [Desulfosarcina alkanivorans]BBO66645.1 transcriptional regulator [Desulfosarcina alkanivorans]
MPIDKTIKILVAEDDYLISEDIIRGLKMQGYANIIEAVDGEDAYEKTCSVHPDIVLMDIMMPRLDGIAAAQKIQACCPTPIVILTAYESSDFVIKARAAGVSAFLTKPPRQDDLERAIVIAMARHADLMELRRLNQALELALVEIKRLQGILPICAKCKKIRDDKGYWQQIEAYISDHSEAEFSHSICPDCARQLYPELCDQDQRPTDGSG